MITSLLRVPVKLFEFLLFLPLFLAWSFLLFLAGNGTQTACRMR